jgi:hypothetical protein
MKGTGTISRLLFWLGSSLLLIFIVVGQADTDLVLHFNTQATAIQCGDASASLTGETFSGQMIQGSDSIKTVGCN